MTYQIHSGQTGIRVPTRKAHLTEFSLHVWFSTRHPSSFCGTHRREVLLTFPNSFNPLLWEGELGRRINCKRDPLPAYAHSLRLFLPCFCLSTLKRLHGGFASTCLHQLQKGACKESCHGTSLQITEVGRCFLIKEIQVMKKMSWVERMGTCQPPTPMRSICFWILWNATVRSGREGRADVGSRMLPAFDSLPCGVQGQSSKSLHPWWTQNNGAVEGFDFLLGQIMHWSFVGLWVFMTPPSLGANDSKEMMCKGQRSKCFQALPFHVALSLIAFASKPSCRPSERKFEVL